MKSAPRPAGNLPNVLLIVVDAMRADHLSCYGYERSTSPNFDQLAARGVLFENAIAASSWTLPSHASMFTGLYPKQHLAQRFQDSLGATVPILAKELERLGYRTGAFSGSPFFTPRQGLGQGFMEFGDFSVSPTQAFLQAHDIRSILRQLGKAEWADKNIGHPSAVDINESVVHWIDKIHAPFFVAVNYYEVHQPNSLPRSWHHHFSTGQRPGNATSSEATPSQVIPNVQSKIDGYDGAIAYDDDSLQKLIGDLGRRHLVNSRCRQKKFLPQSWKCLAPPTAKCQGERSPPCGTDRHLPISGPCRCQSLCKTGSISANFLTIRARPNPLSPRSFNSSSISAGAPRSTTGKKILKKEKISFAPRVTKPLQQSLPSS